MAALRYQDEVVIPARTYRVSEGLEPQAGGPGHRHAKQAFDVLTDHYATKGSHSIIPDESSHELVREVVLITLT